jgi:hypothetical protein
MPGQSVVWDLWCTKWHWDRFFPVGIIPPVPYTHLLHIWTKPGNQAAALDREVATVACYLKNEIHVD